MKILSLDSTATVCSVAVCEDTKLLTEISVNTGNTHSENLLVAVEQGLKFAGCDIDDIELFSCSVGPGSFTGVRIGAATIKGLAFGKNKPCIAVSTLEALANNLICFEGIICPVMNARRGQVYNAVFQCKDGSITRLCPDRALSIEELDIELCDKYDGCNIYLCGDGYDITKSGIARAKIGNTPYRLTLQNAYSVATVALKMYKDGIIVSDEQLTATYLRMSQAERERQEKTKI